jgi:hypothetical protein
MFKKGDFHFFVRILTAILTTPFQHLQHSARNPNEEMETSTETLTMKFTKYTKLKDFLPHFVYFVVRNVGRFGLEF